MLLLLLFSLSDTLSALVIPHPRLEAALPLPPHWYAAPNPILLSASAIEKRQQQAAVLAAAGLAHLLTHVAETPILEAERLAAFLAVAGAEATRWSSWSPQAVAMTARWC